jgi:sarcosine oxidase subunit beta
MAETAASVVIVGAGIVGASVAYHLAQRGQHDVLILEKQDREAAGSTARSVAGVRHQFATEVNVRLSLHSIERLKRFHEELGGHAELRQVGYLLLFDDAASWAAQQQAVALQRSLACARSCSSRRRSSTTCRRCVSRASRERPSVPTTATATRTAWRPATWPGPASAA